MSQAAAAPPAEHISMELEGSAVDGTSAQAATAAAAAVLVALPQAAPAATDSSGQCLLHT